MDLKVQSNFLDKSEWDYVIDKTLHSKNWAFFGTSASDENFTFWGMDLKSDLFFSDFFLKKIESVYNKKFKLSRVYANGQSYCLKRANFKILFIASDPVLSDPIGL